MVTYRYTPIRLAANFLAETLYARRAQMTFKILKDKTFQLRILYSAKLSFIYEGEIKSFPDKQKLRNSINTGPVLQEMFKRVLLLGRKANVKKNLSKVLESKNCNSVSE